ncbi:hypothetical protein JCM6882_007404 [Rhodosporidiobolus microsporus]
MASVWAESSASLLEHRWYMPKDLAIPFDLSKLLKEFPDAFLRWTGGINRKWPTPIRRDPAFTEKTWPLWPEGTIRVLDGDGTAQRPYKVLCAAYRVLLYEYTFHGQGTWTLPAPRNRNVRPSEIRTDVGPDCFLSVSAEAWTSYRPPEVDTFRRGDFSTFPGHRTEAISSTAGDAADCPPIQIMKDAMNPGAEMHMRRCNSGGSPGNRFVDWEIRCINNQRIYHFEVRYLEALRGNLNILAATQVPTDLYQHFSRHESLLGSLGKGRFVPQARVYGRAAEVFKEGGRGRPRARSF